MAIDFSQVKAITIPEGSVKKIEINGVTVWSGKQLVSIAISGATTTFNVGNTWVFGGTVTATYSDGTTADVTVDTTFSGYNMSTAGTQTVTATYTESGITATATYNITVYKVLTSITLSGQTTSLNRGAAFSFGGTVTAHYNDNSTANVTSSTTFSGYNMSKAGTYTVTASYTYRSVTKTATYKLTVNKAWSAVWSGSKTITYNGNNVSGDQTIYTTPKNDGFNIGNYRVTFTMSASGGSGYTTRYNTNDRGLSSSTTTKPASPYRWNTTLTHSYLRQDIVTIYRTTGTDGNTSYYNCCNIGVNTDNTNKNLIFKLAGGRSSFNVPSGVKTSITITKIEKYY